MAHSIPLYEGRIVYAKPPSGRGGDKVCPMIVASKLGTIRTEGKFVAVVISTKFHDPPTPDEIVLPSGPENNTKTQLGKTCVSVCDWKEIIPVEDILGDKGGLIPSGLLRSIFERAHITLPRSR